MLDPCDPVHANRSEAEGTRRKETRDVCVRQVGPASSQTPVCPFPLFFFLFFLSSLFITLFFHDRCRCVPPRRVCPRSKFETRRVGVHLARTCISCIYDILRNQKESRKGNGSKSLGNFLSPCREPLVSYILCLLESGEEEVVKDLVSCSINIYNRASYPISSGFV